MADISDVQAAFASRIAAALYPNGTAHPCLVGAPVVVYPGWPQPAQLDKDIAAKKVNVSVWARGDGSNTTRFRSQAWQETVAPTATLTLETAGDTVTLGGIVSAPQVVAVNGQAYAVQATDTLESIVTALAALLPGSSNAGTVLTCPGGIRHAAIAANGTVARVVRSQTDTVQIIVWAPTPDLRAKVASAIDSALAEERSLLMPDHSCARVMYQSTRSTDESANALIYRRDILFRVEYDTTVSAVATQIATPVLAVAPISAVDTAVNI